MRVVVIVVSLSLGGCTVGDLPVRDPVTPHVPAPACIELTRELLDFQFVPQGMTSEGQELTISNGCSGTLQISRVDVLGQNADAFMVRDLVDVLLRQDEQSTMWVDFTPVRLGAAKARLAIGSNSEDEPEVTVRLLGYGVDF